MLHLRHRTLPLAALKHLRRFTLQTTTRSSWYHTSRAVLGHKTPTFVMASPVTPSSDAALSTTTREVRVIGIPTGERKVSIELDAQETAIFTALLETVRVKNLTCKVRVAGGWVRDKLMGRTSHDIDVALDTMKGVEFATAVNDYLSSHGEHTSSVGVIQANPDQSKHLETATARVLGLWLDFVHLRAETYENNSRIPVVAMGTPQQDAERRDFTINSLLYNLSDGCIEDWTGRGLADLEARTLRTPLPAAVTFRDDPLRVLRAVRFASRFGFTMEPSLRSAAQDGVVHTDLSTKVSRERYGIEVDGMMGPNGRPVAALRALHSLGLTGLVLAPPAGKLIGSFALPGVAHDHPTAAALPSDAVAAAAQACCGTATAGGSSAAGGATLPASWPTVGLAVVEAASYICSLASRAPVAAGWLTQLTHSHEGIHAVAAGNGAEASSAASGSSTPVPGSGYTALMAAVCPWPPLRFHADGNPWEPHPETSPDDSIACGLAPEDRRLLFLAAQLSPLAHMYRVNAKGKEEAVVPALLLESIKRRIKDGQDVQAILNGAQALGAAVDAAGASGGAMERLAVGLALRSVAKEHWRLSVILAAATRLLPVLLDPSCRQHAVGTATGVPESSSQRVASILAPFARLHACIAAWGMDGCWEWKPPLTGAEVLKGLGFTAMGLKPGPATGVLMEELARWQLLHSGSASGASGQAAVGASGASSGAASTDPHSQDFKDSVLAHLQGMVDAAGGPEAFVALYPPPPHGQAAVAAAAHAAHAREHAAHNSLQPICNARRTASRAPGAGAAAASSSSQGSAGRSSTARGVDTSLHAGGKRPEPEPSP